MALKLNKSIKLHIAQMAVREKFQAEFDNCHANFLNTLSDNLYLECKGVEFEGVSDVVMKCVRSTHNVRISSRVSIVVSDELKVIFGVRDLSNFRIEKPYYGTDYKKEIWDLSGVEQEYKDIRLCAKEAQKLFDVLIDSMDSFKSAAKMFAALPWAEKYYPESEKKPTCNIVPVTTINKANELMGVTTDEAES